MKNKALQPIWYFLSFLLIVSLACSLPINIGTKTEIPAGIPTKITEPIILTSTNESSAQSVTTLSDVRKAVIQIQAEGTFVDPEVGLQINAAGRGSGFIIDPSGIAVTNNHVVTGAALIKVWVNGEPQARNARLLGYSECNDLAVIKIDGSDFSYLKWYEGDVFAGLEIYLAGYPLGEPEYSLTKGIISKSNTSGDTFWTSVNGGILAHDATGNPGNSGGPLVTPDGQVVGIHFAGNKDADQYFAISAATAIPIIEDLKKGIDFESLGVNGSIVSNEDGSIVGVWAASVDSGSPADKAGLKPGDIIMQLEGLVLGTDGTMADYCSVIRTHGSNNTLSLTVLRFSSGEFLEGELNGRELEVTNQFTIESPAEPTAATIPTSAVRASPVPTLKLEISLSTFNKCDSPVTVTATGPINFTFTLNKDEEDKRLIPRGKYSFQDSKGHSWTQEFSAPGSYRWTLCRN